MEDGNARHSFSMFFWCAAEAELQISAPEGPFKGRNMEKVPVNCKRNLLIYTSINDKIDGNCEARLMGLNSFDNYIKGGLLWLTL